MLAHKIYFSILAIESLLQLQICNLVKKYYLQDFTEQEQKLLESQLQYYELHVIKHPDFQNMSTISELCRGLKILGKSKIYFLINRLIHLVLTLSVSTELQNELSQL